MPEALHVSSLMLYEFRQSVRFQVWLHSRDKSRGYPKPIAEAALGKLQAKHGRGRGCASHRGLAGCPPVAEILSKRRTISNGHRALDVLHVATALHLSAREFLTFDANQRKLALAEKLNVKP